MNRIGNTHYCDDCDVVFKPADTLGTRNIYQKPYPGYKQAPIYIQPLYTTHSKNTHPAAVHVKKIDL
jgi:hypothetical protein